jgi:hypothetical protein
MSTVLVITPIVISSWPVITAAVSAAIGSLGFAAVEEVRTQSDVGELTREEIELEESEILEEGAGTGDQIVVERDGIRATFSRDARGALRVCMEGRGQSKAELRRIGEELIGGVTQQYAYHKLVTELKQRKMTIVDEQMTEDRSVKIRVRNW